jgi:hypothetical protein
MDIDLTVFPTADACRIARISAGDLENWQTSSFQLGTTVAEGRRTRRLYSAADLIHLRCVTALCAPTPSGYRQRMFASPALAFAMVASIAPFDQFIVTGADGCLRAPAEHWFACFGVVGTDTHMTYDLLNGEQLTERLLTVDNQMLVLPVSRLVFEVLSECSVILKAMAYPKAVAKVVVGMTKAGADAATFASELTTDLKAAATAAFREKGLLEEDENK